MREIDLSEKEPSSMTARTTAQTTAELSRFFEENGYVVLEDALTPEQIDEIRHETTAICRGEVGAVVGVNPPAPGASDDEVIKRYLCIHHPHKVSDVMQRYMFHPPIVDLLTSVIGPNVKSMQSMLFVKASGKPGQAWHQDENFIPTRDRSLTGAWIALDDATTENGCLWVIPGSHKDGILWPTRETTDERFDCADEAVGFPYSDDEQVPVEVAAGSAVLFNGYLLHRSLPNTTRSGFRRALVNHYMSAESLLAWSHAREDFRDVVLVAGKDPYAYKGVERLASPQVRPEGVGGCAWVDEDTIAAALKDDDAR
jgi:phytanoyl-CoA hydroxylase